MAATDPDHDADVQDQLRAWWKTFLNGAVVDEEEEEEEDSEAEEEPDNDREEDKVGEEGASAAITVTVTASEVDQQRTVATVLLEKESSGGAALHGDEESPEGGYVQQLQAGLLGRKRKVVAMRSKPQAIEIETQDAKGEEIPGVQIWRREPIMTRSKRQATGIEIQDAKGEGSPEDTSVHLQGELAGTRRAAIMTRSKLRTIQEEQRRC